MYSNLKLLFYGFIFCLLPISEVVANSNQAGTFLSKESLALPSSIQAELDGLNEKDQIIFLLDIIEKVQFEEPDSAIKCAKIAIQLSQEAGEEFYEAQSRFWFADLSFNQSIYTNNLEVLYSHLDIASSIFEKRKENIWLIRSWNVMAEIANSISVVHQNKGDDYELEKKQKTKAQNNLRQAFQLFYQQKSSDQHKVLEGYLIANKGTINHHARSDSAMIFWLEAETIFEKEKDYLGLARVNLNKALFSKDNRNTEYFEKTIQLYQQINNHSALKRAYLRYGSFYIDQYQDSKKIDDWENGYQLLLKGWSLSEEGNICDALNRLGHAYAVKNKIIPPQGINSAQYYFDEGIDSAQYYFAEGIYESKKENNAYCLWSFMEAKQATLNCDTLANELTNAYNHILANREGVVTKAVIERENYFQQVKTKEEKQKRNRLIIYGLGLLSIIAFIFFLIVQRQRIKSLKNKTKAQEATLQAQAAKIQALGARMNPHFISNTLNAIDSMIYTNDKAEASKYLVKFAKLSRLVLANSASSLISLEKELEMLDHYLSLEKMRFEDEIEFEVEVDERLDLNKINIPPMLLQPFIENAIIHGIQPKEGSGKVSIHILSNDKNQLECIIEDNGIGRAQAKTIQQQSSVERESFSMKIAEDRIQLINNMEGASLITIDLHNTFGEACGTKIIITIPKNLSEHDKN